MRGAMLLAGLGLTIWGAKTRPRVAAWALCAGLLVCMGAQQWALWRSGLLSLQTALPLHLCGAFAVLCLPMTWLRLRALYDLIWLLGTPCALLALVFPAVLPVRDALAMRLGFYGVHVLIPCCALLLRLETDWALPQRGHGALVALNLFAAAVQGINHALGCNYLFLRLAPEKTPLAFLQAKGQGVYVFSLELLAMLLLTLLPALYTVINRGSKPPHSRSGRHSSPSPNLCRR